MEYSDIKLKLWKHFLAADLIPSSNMYVHAIACIYDQGREIYNSIDKSLRPAGQRKDIFSNIDHVRPQDLIRVIGFGSILTEFMIEPFKLPVAIKDKTIQLGALANLIVTLFDSFADRQKSANGVIQKVWLQASRQERIGSSISRMLASPTQRIMKDLIQLYFQKLESLVMKDSAHSVRAEKAIREIIQNMYEAEIKTLHNPVLLNEYVWRRKSALPFVAMGAPVWLSLPDDKASRWHMRWMYHVGLMFGCIDDAVDYEHDLQEKSFNHIHNKFRNDEKNQSMWAEYFCDRVINKTQQLNKEWRENVDGLHKSNPLLTDVLSITICSWFGGPVWHPIPAAQSA